MNTNLKRMRSSFAVVSSPDRELMPTMVKEAEEIFIKSYYKLNLELEASSRIKEQLLEELEKLHENINLLYECSTVDNPQPRKCSATTVLWACEDSYANIYNMIKNNEFINGYENMVATKETAKTPGQMEMIVRAQKGE